MPWWVWLLLAWCAVALLVAFSLLAAALRLAERRDWARRGSPDRRNRSRSRTHTAASAAPHG